MSDREWAQVECEAVGHEWKSMDEGIYQCAICLLVDFYEDEIELSNYDFPY